MTTVALSTTPATLNPGTAYELDVVNSGSTIAHVQIAGGLIFDQRINPGQTIRVQPNGQAVTAFARSGSGQVTTTSYTNPEASPSGAYALRNALAPARAATRLGPYNTYAFPTVTVSASNAATTFGTGNYNVPAATWDANATLDTTHFVYSDGPVKSNLLVPTGIGAYRNTGYSNYSVPSIVDGNLTVHIGFVGQNIELLLPATSFKYRILVDGVVDPAGWRTMASGNSLYRVLLAFAEVADRTITVQMPAGQISGVTLERDGLIYRAEMPKLPFAIIQGDSIGAGQNTDGTKLETYPVFLGQQMGWDVWADAEGGTGFVNPGTSTGFQNAVTRLATRVIPYSPDIVGAAFGLNDMTTAGYTMAQTDTQIRAWKAALDGDVRTANAFKFVVGPFFTVDQATDSATWTPMKALRDQQLATCAAIGLPYVDTLGWQTGKYGTSGTANVILTNDGIHPKVAGHRYYASRIARALTVLMGKSGSL